MSVPVIYYKTEVYKLLSNIVKVYNTIPDVTEITTETIINKLSDSYPELNEDNELKIDTPALIFEESLNEPDAWSEGIVTSRRIEYTLELFQKQPSNVDKEYIIIEDLMDIIVKTMEFSGFKTIALPPDFDDEANFKQRVMTFLLADKDKLKEKVENL